MTATPVRSGPPVCLVSSSGGHLELLASLESAFAGLPRLWVTPPSERADALARRGEAVRHVRPWDLRMLDARAVLDGVRIAGRVRPRLVVTTGAGVAVPFCLVARALGARIVFVETMARISTPSVSGRILSRFARRSFVQWAPMAQVYPGATVCRPALLEDVRPAPEQQGTGTFVAVGTHNKPFDRLLGMVDEAAGAGILPSPVLAQTGVSAYRPRHFEACAWLSPAEMTAAVAEHRVVVCHTGSGIVSTALRAGRRPLMLPRETRHDEHVDDHQVDMARALAAWGLGVHAGERITAEDVAATAGGPLALPEEIRRAPALADAVHEALHGLLPA